MATAAVANITPETADGKTLEAPRYDPPPPFVPPEQRASHPQYRLTDEEFRERKVLLKRPNAQSPLGFNIRGGKENGMGIFISKITPGGLASDKGGLLVGDLVLEVNGMDCHDIEHAFAVTMLKSSSDISLRVRYAPYDYKMTFVSVRTEAAAAPPKH